MKIVYATATAFIGFSLVREGSHWPADDPVVLTQPSFFSEDPRYGLSYSVQPPPEEEVRQKRAYVRHS